MKKFENLKIVKNFKYFGPIALAIILVGVVLMFTIKMNVGLDFAGGAKIDIDLEQYTTLHEDKKQELLQVVEQVIEDNGFTSSNSERWSETGLEVGLKYFEDGKEIDASNDEQKEAFIKNIQRQGGLLDEIKYAIEEFIDDSSYEIGVTARIVDSSTALTLLKNTIWATIVAIAVMLIYIMIRFTPSSAVAAIISLTHDVLMMLALTTMFRVQVNTTFIAAIITIIGYSINATIVIFDKIRTLKGLESMKGVSDEDIADLAINKTLGRTIITTITTFATIAILAIVCSIMGIATMSEFALPIMFGLIAGTYSSVLLACPIWIYVNKFFNFIKAKK